MRHGSDGSSITLAAIVSVLAIPAGPVAIVAFFLVDHVLAYRGTCGPYPTDIPAYACGFGEYLVNFAEPFAVAGLVALSVIAMALTLVVLTASWLVGGLVFWLRRASSQ